jgi:UDP-glucuronate 4-epimerase
MALFLFTKAILTGEPIPVFNNGKHKRAFTYIDDAVECVVRLLDRISTSDASWDPNHPDPASSNSPYRLFNVGSANAVSLLRYIEILEASLGIKARMEFLPLQPGDVPDTEADISDLAEEVGYTPRVSVEEGVDNFVRWYRSYFHA